MSLAFLASIRISRRYSSTFFSSLILLVIGSLLTLVLLFSIASWIGIFDILFKVSVTSNIDSRKSQSFLILPRYFKPGVACRSLSPFFLNFLYFVSLPRVFFVMDLDLLFLPGLPKGISKADLMAVSCRGDQVDEQASKPSAVDYQRLGSLHFSHFASGCFSTNPEVAVEACSSRVFSSALKGTVMQVV